MQLKNLYVVKLVENRKDLIQILELKSNQTFLIPKYKNQARGFTIEELEKTLKALIDLDYKFKQVEIDVNIGLQTIICGM